MPLQIRRGTDAERLAMTQPLAAGELLFVTNTQRIFAGNGTTNGGIAVTGYTNAESRDQAAAIFASGTHSGITFAYNTATDAMSVTVDLSDYQGVIQASAFNGSLVSDNSTLLVDAVTGTIVGPVVANVTGNVTGNVNGVVTGTAGSSLVGNVTGNIFTTLIDSADSSAITITPAAIFSSDVTVQNNLTVSSDIIVSNIAATSAVTSDSMIVAPGAGNGFELSVNNDGLKVKTGQDSYVTVEGESFANDTHAIVILRSSRYAGTARAAVQNLDDLGIIAFEGYTGSEFKKSAIIASEIVSTISAGTFNSDLVVSVLNADGNYRQFKFLSTGIFDAGAAVKMLPLPDASLGSVAVTEGTFGYGSDRKSVAVYNGSTFITLPSFVAVPASKTSSGKQGQVSADANYFYICYSTNNWIRVDKDATW